MTGTFERLPSIPIFLDARSVRSGSPSYIGWEAGSSTQHHFLISGNSGSGKSTHLMLCLAKVQKYMPRSTRLYLMDFKGSDDFRYLRDIHRVVEYREEGEPIDHGPALDYIFPPPPPEPEWVREAKEAKQIEIG